MKPLLYYLPVAILSIAMTAGGQPRLSAPFPEPSAAYVPNPTTVADQDSGSGARLRPRSFGKSLGSTTAEKMQDYRLVETLWERWDGVKLANSEMYKYSYDDSGKLGEVLTLLWDTDRAQWVNGGLQINSYDLAGNQTEALNQGWSGGQWHNSWRDVFTYDAAGNMTEFLTQYWDLSQWRNGDVVTYSYDGTGKLTLEVQRLWQDNRWINGARFSYSYSGVQDLGDAERIKCVMGEAELLIQMWDGAQWTDDELDSCQYDAGRLTEFLWQTRIGAQWVNHILHTYTYDDAGNLTEELVRYWNSSQSVWENEKRDTYSYDALGDMTEFLWQNWQGGQWVNNWSETYFYDAARNVTVELGRGADWNGTEWIWGDRDRYTHTWEAISVSREGDIALPSSFSLSQNYPNPFNPVTTISYDLPQAADVTLTVVDLLGRTVRELASGTQPAGKYAVSFDATALPSGVYFYRLEAGDFVKTNRMVVVK